MPRTLFETFFLLKDYRIHMSSPNRTIRSLRKEGGNRNFEIVIHRALKATTDILSLERNNKQFQKKLFFRLAFTSFMLLKQLLNNLPICLLNCIWTHVSIKVNALIQKHAYYVHT